LDITDRSINLEHSPKDRCMSLSSCHTIYRTVMRRYRVESGILLSAVGTRFYRTKNRHFPHHEMFQKTTRL